MDVKTATKASPAQPLASLNTKKASDSTRAKRWGDSLNAAMDGRAHATQNGASVNTTGLSDAQKSRRDAGVNGAKRKHAASDDLNAAIHRKPAIAEKKINEKAQPKHKAELLNDNVAPQSDTEMRQKAQTLVNQFFVGTMLKQMRDDPFKSDLFNGGKAGDAYAGMFDQRVAEHAGNRMARSLVESMVKRYRRINKQISSEPKHDASIAITA